MKFIADVMLGRLAKRMRLLGFDVLYDRTLSDNEILRLALEQNRVILTRDTALAARPLAANNVFIKNDGVQEQIRQVLATLPSDQSPSPLTRCSECNHPLTAVAKQEIRDSVPHYVYDKYDAFRRCSSCGRVYWRGTHVNGMEKAGMVTLKKPGSPA